MLVVLDLILIWAEKRKLMATKGLFGSYFLKLFLRTVFENTGTINSVFGELFLFIEFSVFYILWESNMFSVFSLFSLFFKT